MKPLELDLPIAVGLGDSFLQRDGETIIDCEMLDSTLGDCEKIAAVQPDHDWRIVRYGPLHGETFQRHGQELWVCIESNEGFA